ncbi:MAG: UDP-N-acetyl-2-amino-2-deoxyglucuronate dehydrogenase [Verrucomicrobiales bacterium]|jgi:UDP-N-acetyl-2-amino-2-deoxyglucuronate dehydrogenase
MTDREFSFVIVGSGNIARTYWDAISRVDGISIVGLVSRSLTRPDFLPAEVPVFASIDDAARSEGIDFDAIALCTPNGTHAKAAITAAALGKHVLVEKVLEISAPAMDRMIAACHRANVSLAVTFQRRMSPDNQLIKQLLETGALGNVFAADMRVKFWRDDAYYASGAYRGGYAIDGGGPFIQQAAHNVDLFVWFFGMPSKVVSMLGTFNHTIEVEDHGIALLHYSKGMIGSITASSACKPGFSTVLEIHSDRGSIVMENDVITQWMIEGIDSPIQTPSDFEIHDGAESAAVTDTAGHEAIIADFVDAIREQRPPCVTGESARLATDLVLEIYRSNLLRSEPTPS